MVETQIGFHHDKRALPSFAALKDHANNSPDLDQNKGEAH